MSLETKLDVTIVIVERGTRLEVQLPKRYPDETQKIYDGRCNLAKNFAIKLHLENRARGPLTDNGAADTDALNILINSRKAAGSMPSLKQLLSPFKPKRQHHDKYAHLKHK